MGKSSLTKWRRARITQAIGQWKGAIIASLIYWSMPLTGGELKTPRQLRPTTMTNLLGEDIRMRQPGHWHDYGKAEPKAGRKMGHVSRLD